MTFPGCTSRAVRVAGAEYHVITGGAGPPVLLLHGFPEHHWCWRHVVPELAQAHVVVAADLKGYGRSRARPGGPRGEGYSKREMAAELVDVMHVLGHRTFAVVGHDRGARVAYRMALDHPDVVERLVAINIVPTIDQFERMNRPSLGYWPWFLLAQPADVAERLVAAAPRALVEHALDTWASTPTHIDEEARRRYAEAVTPAVIAAMCADYRASYHLDRSDDDDDRRAGRRIECPTLVVVGEDEVQLDDAERVWRSWCSDLLVREVPGGHFVPEESPSQLVAELRPFLRSRATARG